MPYKDPEERSAYRRAYRASHREEENVSQRAYRATHREEYQAYLRAYCAAHPMRHVEARIRRLRRIADEWLSDFTAV